MKKLLICNLLFVLILSGCRTVKNDFRGRDVQAELRVDSVYKSVYVAQLQQNVLLREHIDVLERENVRLRSEIDTHEIEYDTDKPIDPATNLPPKKWERFHHNKQLSEIQSETTVKDESTVDIDYSFFTSRIDSLNSALTAKIKEHEDYKSSIKRRMAFDVWWFWIGFGVLISILIWLIMPNFSTIIRYLRNRLLRKI